MDDDPLTPPPCPWCGKPEVLELGDGNSDVRAFNCRACHRIFTINIIAPSPPERES